jgi:8-oxo-dGTP pyrophosphatase MutT (NUDIX family)
MKRPPVIKKQISSGGVIFRTSEAGTEVALIKVKGKEAWGLPKGLIDKDEDPPAAALREVREESGLQGNIVEKIGQISYWYFIDKDKIKVHKTVHFFLLRYVKGSTRDHDDEVDEAKWCLIDKAIETLSYRSEQQIMQKAKGLIEGLKGESAVN